ncbi:MAG TPA: YdeI/OmpD-associated family protein [Bacteroidales bacterium]|nr:YdeI/OmpD-associated family protein [Bacteroidales bacterium]
MAVSKETPNDQNMSKPELPVLLFETPGEWRDWLEQNHQNTEGVWLQFYKKDTGIKSLNHDTALDEALCFGWIDGQANKYDEKSYLQKFTPRRKRSIWSKRNIEHIERLGKEGKMHPAGWREVEAAKADGRWNNAYNPPSQMIVPDDFLAELAKDKEAMSFFETLNKTNKFAISFRLHNAKRPETRAKRIQTFVEMMKKREKLY